MLIMHLKSFKKFVVYIKKITVMLEAVPLNKVRKILKNANLFFLYKDKGSEDLRIFQISPVFFFFTQILVSYPQLCGKGTSI